MVAGGEDDVVAGLVGRGAGVEDFDGASLARLGEEAGGEAVVCALGKDGLVREEALPVLLRVERREAEVCFVGRDGRAEGILVERLVGPAPGAASVGRNGRPARADGMVGEEAEDERVPGRAADAEGPVEPGGAGVAKVGADEDGVALDVVDLDVPARETAID